MKHPISIDIFCSVVDNFGDIGVCWRLARQLTVERGQVVRLFVDDMESFRAIVPEPDVRVEVLYWASQDSGSPLCEQTFGLHRGDDSVYVAADVVIEAFACDLPELVVAAMVVRRSVWIDLEYLSAEDWVAGCHAIPSTHPSTGLKKTLFFPGFDARTGGVLRENDLISRRDVFQNDINAQNLWRKAHFLPEIQTNTLDVSLFCYATAPLEGFLEAAGRLGQKVRVFRPVRGAAGDCACGFTLTQPSPIKGEGFKGVEVWEVPFFSQYEYDYLLWTCGLNFVRGEDSFVRAQLAGKPFIWNIYVQEEEAHLVKLSAFLDKIKPFYDVESFERLANLHDLWNEGGQIPKDNWVTRQGTLWRDGLQSLVGIASGARNWADYLVKQSDLATQLLDFATDQITENKGSFK